MPYKKSQLRAMFSRGGKSAKAARSYLRNRKAHRSKGGKKRG
jgi:hypothetical protein